MSKTFSTKTLLASSAIAFGLLVALGSAQAQPVPEQETQPPAAAQEVQPPTAGTARQIEVLPGTPAGGEQSETETRADRAEAPADAPTNTSANPPANTPDGAPQAATLADAPPNASQDASPNASQDGPPADAAPTTTATAPTQAAPQAIISDETKRKNRQRYIERYEARQYGEPRDDERYVEPRYVKPKPRYVEPRYVEPRYVAPRHYVERDYEYRQHAKPNYKQAPRREYREYYGSRGGY